ncbi:riboflavin biosynthesis protein [Fulvitalea axinellae]|uniref:Riboflavin biosynthesis protein n=1 Tax=Fulvitalea axinellae TaxID=1182444 RepID=A0AAU9CUT1_9BACT|nr:riboflavin biosynthesis protein [Fulvitalea axinellae]
MKVYRGIEGFEKPDFAVVTSGTFDGVHAGHRRILARLKELADARGGETVLVTFWPHPRHVLDPEGRAPMLLSELDEKIELLEDCGLDHLVILPFTRSLSETSSLDFIKTILLDGIGTKMLVIGYDHRFGKNREGGFAFLKEKQSEFGFELEEITPVEIRNSAISSTKTRAFLESGDVKSASGLLNRPYGLRGEVVHGRKVGRLLNYPTANIEVRSEYKLIPKDGVYAVRVEVDGQKFGAMMNIGHKPTFEQNARSIEAHMFDFSGDIYGKVIRIEFVDRIRNEMKFSSKNELMDQLKLDEINSKTILGM